MAKGGCADAKCQQVALGLAGAGAQHAQFGPGGRVTAVQKALPGRRLPQFLGMILVLTDRLAELSQQRQGQGEVAAPVLPQRGGADADAPGQFARRAGAQLQSAEERLQVIVGAGVELADRLKLLGRDAALLAEREELL